MELSIVIPAHNEEKRVLGVLESYSLYFDRKLQDEYEIIVVCDSCEDNTVSIVKEFENRNSRTTALISSERLGKGGAIAEGFKTADGRCIGFVDCDESVPPDEFEKLFFELKKGAHCGVIASRWIEGANILVRQPMSRRMASRIFNIVVWIIFGLPFKDTQCGAKIFRGDIIKKILPDFVSNGFEFDVELLWRINREGCIVGEIPIRWAHEEDSKFRLYYAPKMFISLLMLRLDIDGNRRV